MKKTRNIKRTQMNGEIEKLKGRIDIIKSDLEKLTSKEEALQVIIDIVEDVTGVDIRTKTRKRENVDARFIYSSLAWKYVDAPLALIGGFIDVDHTSVMHHKKQTDNLLGYDKGFIEKFNACESRIPKVEESEFVRSQLRYHLQKARKYMEVLKAS